MKRLLILALIGLSLSSCMEQAQESLSDNQDALVEQIATSEVYHNYQTMLRHSLKIMQETDIDYDAISALSEQSGKHFKEMEESEFAHIQGALVLRQMHNLSAKAIEPMQKLFPTYNEMNKDLRMAIQGRYHEHRSVSTIDLLVETPKNRRQ